LYVCFGLKCCCHDTCGKSKRFKELRNDGNRCSIYYVNDLFLILRFCSLFYTVSQLYTFIVFKQQRCYTSCNEPRGDKYCRKIITYSSNFSDFRWHSSYSIRGVARITRCKFTYGYHLCLLLAYRFSFVHLLSFIHQPASRRNLVRFVSRFNICCNFFVSSLSLYGKKIHCKYY